MKSVNNIAKLLLETLVTSSQQFSFPKLKHPSIEYHVTNWSAETEAAANVHMHVFSEAAKFDTGLY